MVLKLRGMAYGESRETFKLPTLKERRFRENIITSLILISSHDDLNTDLFFKMINVRTKQRYNKLDKRTDDKDVRKHLY